MKKFLSLLLAMIMSLSLVTISAGATEYKDLTDKDELGPQYQEAVAVLNKIGVITGYDDGSFRPDVKLTRGAAAKIIVSLLIGPEAATNLPNNYAPYPDVPTGHTFAGVISYCKTAGIISGYGDGTFKPANDLTGYAFAKMLLGALGYDASIEGFVDTGWTMNVLSVGQYASLFDRLDFHGSEAVTRKDAALMALNTLKSTVVEYSNPTNITVTGTDTNVVVNGGQVRSYKTSNQDYARNILPQRRDIANSTTSRADYNTVEFAEEHFVDLRLPHDKYQPIEDNYGRPCAEWSYRKLSIGKFPLVPDFEYTTQVIHDVDTVTPASKVRALELNGYNTDDAVLYVNGVAVDNDFEVAEIADYTDNGTLVQVYVDNNGADSITHVVVVKSQLMTVKRIGSDYVSLELYKDGKGSDGKEGNNYAGKVSDPAINKIYGFNQIPIDVKINNVETGDDYFEFLSGLKAGDFVVVEPVSSDGSATSWDVGHVYAPETVKGALNGVPTRYGDTTHDYSALSVDVGGTTYNVSLWNKDLYDIDPDVVRVTKKDVTLVMDRYGNALLAQDVGDVSGWLIVGNYRQSIVNGILVTFANGWDLSGNEVSLNIGARAGVSNWINSNDDVWDQNALPRIGSLVHYTNDTSSNTGEWELSQNNQYGDNGWGVYNVFNTNKTTGEKYSIRANSSAVTVENSDKNDNQGHPIAVREASYVDTATMLMADGIKFIYVTSDDSGELDTIEIKTTRTSVDNEELSSTIANGNGHGRAQAAVEWAPDDQKVNSNASVKAIVIKQDNSDATYKNLMYVVDYEGSAMRDANGQMVQGYKVAMLDANGKVVITTVYAYRTSLQVGDFARFTKSTHDDHPDDFYTLRHYNGPAIGKGAAIIKDYVASFKGANKNLMTIKNTGAVKFNMADTYAEDRNVYTELSGAGEDNNDTFADNMLNLRGAQWVDLSNYKYDIDDADDLKKAMTNDDGSKNDIQVTLLFNDDKTSDNFRSVYMIIINSIKKSTATTTDTTGDVTLASNVSGMGTISNSSVQILGSGAAYATFTITPPSWARPNVASNVSGDPKVKINYDVYVDGVRYTLGSELTSVSGGALVANSSNTAWTVTNLSLPAPGGVSYYGKDVSVVIKSVTWGGVAVQFAGATFSSTSPASSSGVGIDGADNIAFTVSSNDYTGNVTWTVTGGTVETTDGGTDNKTSGTTPAGTATTLYDVQPTGDGPVVVTISGTTANPFRGNVITMDDVKVEDVDESGKAKSAEVLSFTATGDATGAVSNTASGKIFTSSANTERATVTMKLAGVNADVLGWAVEGHIENSAGATVESFKVNDIRNGDTVTLKNAAGSNISLLMDKDYVVKVDKATPLDNMTATASYDANTKVLTVTFNKDLTAAPAYSAFNFGGPAGAQAANADVHWSSSTANVVTIDMDGTDDTTGMKTLTITGVGPKNETVTTTYAYTKGTTGYVLGAAPTVAGFTVSMTDANGNALHAGDKIANATDYKIVLTATAPIAATQKAAAAKAKISSSIAAKALPVGGSKTISGTTDAITWTDDSPTTLKDFSSDGTFVAGTDSVLVAGETITITYTTGTASSVDEALTMPVITFTAPAYT